MKCDNSTEVHFILRRTVFIDAHGISANESNEETCKVKTDGGRLS